MILRVFGQSAVRPGLRAFEIVIVRIEAHQVHRQFAPGDDLIEKRFFVRLGRIGLFHRQRHRDGADVAEVQVGRKTAGVVGLWLIALRAVSGQLVLDEIRAAAEVLRSSRRAS